MSRKNPPAPVRSALLPIDPSPARLRAAKAGGRLAASRPLSGGHCYDLFTSFQGGHSRTKQPTSARGARPSEPGMERYGGADKSAECRGIVSMLFCAPTRCRRRGSFTSSEDERLDKGLLIRRAGCGKVASP